MTSEPTLRVLLERGASVGAFFRGMRVVALVTAGRYGLNFITQIILARFLFPADFGLYALGLTVVTAATTVASLRADRWLIEGAHTARHRVDVAFTIELILSLLVLAQALWVIPVLFDALNRSEATSTALILSSTILLSPFCVLRGTLERDLRFGRAWAPQLVSVVASSIVSVAAAAVGAGVLALVIGRVLGGLLEALCWWSLATYRPRLVFSIAECRDIARFGLPLTGASLLIWVYWNVDYLIVDRVLGAVELGSYFLAFHLTQHLLHFRTGLTQVAFPILARSTARDRADAFHDYTWFGAVLYMWMLGIILGAGHVLVPLVLGDKWAPSIAPLQVLTAVTAWRGITAFGEPILLLQNGRGILLVLSAISCVVLPVAAIPLTHAFGINGTALAVAITVMVAAPLLLRAVAKRLDGGLRLGHCLRGPFVASGTAVLVARLIVEWRPGFDGVGAAVLVGTLAYGGILFAIDRSRVVEILARTRSQ